MWAVPGYAHASFFPKVFMGYYSDGHYPVMNLKFVALPVPEIIAIGVLGGVRTPNLGEEEVVGGRGWYHSKERM